MLVASSLALAVTPDCSFTQQFTNSPTINPDNLTVFPLSGAPALALNNNLGANACQAWTVFYSFDGGITASSVEIDTSNTLSGVYVLFPGTVNYGSNPYTVNVNGYSNLTGTYNYLRISPKFITGVGTITVQAFGWINPANVGSIVQYPVVGQGGPPSGNAVGFGIQNGATYPNNLNTQFGNASSIPGACTYNVSPTLQNNGQIYTCGSGGTYAVSGGGTPGGTAGADVTGTYPSALKITGQYGLASSGSIAAALTAIGSSTATLAINQPTTLSTNTTIPANVALLVSFGNKISCTGTPTVTVNGTINVNAYQIFDQSCYTGGASLVLNTSPILPEWLGAVADSGTTDNTAALNAAFAAAQNNAQINLTCPAGGWYAVSGVVNFASYHRYVGNGDSSFPYCRILSSLAASSPTAFNFVGVQNVTLDHLIMVGNASTSPVKTIAMFGSTNTQSTRNGSYISCHACSFQGYASTAAIYGVGSEVWNWDQVAKIIYNGGGATYRGVYLSSQDDLGICSSCKPLSETDIHFDQVQFSDFTVACSTGSFLVGLGSAAPSTSSAISDVSFSRGLFTTNCDGTGTAYQTVFDFGTNQGPIVIDSNRAENPKTFAHVETNANPVNVTITNNSMNLLAGGAYFLDGTASGTSVTGFTEAGNYIITNAGVNTASGITSSILGCTASHFGGENFNVTCSNNPSGTTSYGGISAIPFFQTAGNQPTATVTGTGCSLGTVTGNNVNGYITVTGGGTCTVTLGPWSWGLAFQNSSICSPLQNRTQRTTVPQTSGTTTTATFAPMTLVASDTLQYSCSGF